MMGIDYWEEVVVFERGDNAEEEVHSDVGADDSSQESEEEELPPQPRSTIRNITNLIRMIVHL
jgi:hypothetical protein